MVMGRNSVKIPLTNGKVLRPFSPILIGDFSAKLSEL